jgi:hypothetical protein
MKLLIKQMIYISFIFLVIFSFQSKNISVMNTEEVTDVIKMCLEQFEISVSLCNKVLLQACSSWSITKGYIHCHCWRECHHRPWAFKMSFAVTINKLWTSIIGLNDSLFRMIMHGSLLNLMFVIVSVLLKCLASSKLLSSNWLGEWFYWKSLLECGKCEAVSSA